MTKQILERRLTVNSLIEKLEEEKAWKKFLSEGIRKLEVDFSSYRGFKLMDGSVVTQIYYKNPETITLKSPFYDVAVIYDLKI